MREDTERLDHEDEITVLSPEPLLAGERWSRPLSETLSPDEIAEVLARVRLAVKNLPSPAQVEERLARSLPFDAPDLKTASGAFDAEKVADVLGISAAALATALNACRYRFARPSGAQNDVHALWVYARIVVPLRALLPDEVERRAWLDRPQPRWENRSSMEMLLAGDGEPVAHLLERICYGGGGE